MDEKDDEDVLFMGPDVGEDRDIRPFVRRRPGQDFEAGLMRPVRDGEPLDQDAVFLEHKGPGPVYRVTNVFEPKESGIRSRPSTDDYRDGWDRIFGNKTPVGQA